LTLLCTFKIIRNGVSSLKHVAGSRRCQQHASYQTRVDTAKPVSCTSNTNTELDTLRCHFSCYALSLHTLQYVAVFGTIVYHSTLQLGRAVIAYVARVVAPLVPFVVFIGPEVRWMLQFLLKVCLMGYYCCEALGRLLLAVSSVLAAVVIALAASALEYLAACRPVQFLASFVFVKVSIASAADISYIGTLLAGILMAAIVSVLSSSVFHMLELHTGR
jgi:hypothetical protein